MKALSKDDAYLTRHQDGDPHLPQWMKTPREGGEGGHSPSRAKAASWECIQCQHLHPSSPPLVIMASPAAQPPAKDAESTPLDILLNAITGTRQAYPYPNQTQQVPTPADLHTLGTDTASSEVSRSEVASGGAYLSLLSRERGRMSLELASKAMSPRRFLLVSSPSRLQTTSTTRQTWYRPYSCGTLGQLKRVTARKNGEPKSLSSSMLTCLVCSIPHPH